MTRSSPRAGVRPYVPQRLRDADRQHRYAVHLLAEAASAESAMRARVVGAMAAEHLQLAARALAESKENM